MSARAENQPVQDGTRGPDDDFFCHKYQVWYRVEDCVYRGRNRTYAGCVDCFQGYVNIRSVEQGIRPPAFMGRVCPSVRADEGDGRSGTVLPFVIDDRKS